VAVEADAAPVDLTDAQMDQLERASGDAALLGCFAERLERAQGIRHNRYDVLHSCLHGSVSSTVCMIDSSSVVTSAIARPSLG
jgi:hypothetical protein